MANKQRPIDFQSIAKHIPEIEKVRTDIKVHWETEHLLKQLRDKMGLEDEEFDIIFESRIEPKQEEKKKLFKKKEAKQKNLLRSVAATQFNLLLSRAKLEEFQGTVRAEKTYQQEIIQFKKAHPEVAKMHLDFTRVLSPEYAVDFLLDMEKSNQKNHQTLDSLFEKHQKGMNTFMKQYETLMKEFTDQLKEKGIVSNQKDIQHAFRLMSGVVND